MFPAIFLDRDGVIIENRENYVKSWDDVELFPQALRALARLNQGSYKIVIFTNQSAIGRGLVSLSDVEGINKHLLGIIQKAGGHIDGFFLCPHTPEDRCECRKPKPGLLFQAAHSLSIDLYNSIVIGDALSDLMAGKTAGVRQLILVRTGRGKVQETLPEAFRLKPFDIADNLETALDVLKKNIPGM